MVTDIICCCGTTVAGATFWWSPAIPQSLSVLSPDPETTRRPSGDTATPLTYNEDPVHKSSTQSGRRAPHGIRVPLQRRHACTGRHVPHLERLVARRRHDAPPVRKHRNAIDLQRTQITKVVHKADAARRTQFECPFSVRNSASLDGSSSLVNGMNRRSPRDAVETALASQIDCSTFIGSACDGVVATSALTASVAPLFSTADGVVG